VVEDGVRRWRVWSQSDWDMWRSGRWTEEEEQAKPKAAPKPVCGPRLAGRAETLEGQVEQLQHEFNRLDDKLVTHANSIEERVTVMESEVDYLKDQQAERILQLEAEVGNVLEQLNEMKELLKERGGWVRASASQSRS
jgi:DNA repair exonuclease SbcCD ATPase subunit